MRQNDIRTIASKNRLILQAQRSTAKRSTSAAIFKQHRCDLNDHLYRFVCAGAIYYAGIGYHIRLVESMVSVDATDAAYVGILDSLHQIVCLWFATQRHTTLVDGSYG